MIAAVKALDDSVDDIEPRVSDMNRVVDHLSASDRYLIQDALAAVMVLNPDTVSRKSAADLLQRFIRA